jgi:hypothetical protein
MSDTVFILGAGASKQAGAPVMANFLDEARKLLYTNDVENEKANFELVFKSIGALQSVHSKSQLNLDNIESVMAAFEIAETLRKFPDSAKTNGIDRITALNHLIAKTIARTLRFPYTQDSGLMVPAPYKDFVDLIKYLQTEVNPHHSVAVITFNYDIACDFAFTQGRIFPDYGISNRVVTIKSIPFLKLHGSLHWSYNDNRTEIDIRPIDVSSLPYRLINSRLAFVDFTNEDRFKNGPVIVPPTWNKSEHHSNLASVWNRAATELECARNIFIIGYSLPITDSFFHYLWALGTHGPNPLEKIWVFNPEDSVEQRFRDMLGPGAISRFKFFGSPISPNFSHSDGTFSRAINIIRSAFPKSIS